MYIIIHVSIGEGLYSRVYMCTCRHGPVELGEVVSGPHCEYGNLTQVTIEELLILHGENIIILSFRISEGLLWSFSIKPVQIEISIFTFIFHSI